MRGLRRIHTIHGFTVFILTFAVLFIPFLVPIFFPKKFRWIGKINRVWAKATLIFTLLPYRVVERVKLDPGRNYLFCPNHFSFLDIPTMGLNPIDTVFVGKNDLANIPLFGWMYKKLHITVDRARLRSKYDTYLKSAAALDQGKSLVIYPEGGIYSPRPPELARFKDGAFRLAIEKQIPIVPVTIPHNWIILPGNDMLVRFGKVEVIFHEPIETRGVTISDLQKIKDQVFQVIQTELNKHGNKSRHPG